MDSENQTHKISDYVERLDNIPDNEAVLFNFAVNDEQSGKFEQIMSEQGLSLGDNTSEWLCRQQGGNQSDSHLLDVWSPTMTAKEAKEVMPNLVAAMDEAKISSNLIVPMLAKDIFKDQQPYEPQTQEWIESQLPEFLTKCCYDQLQPADWKGFDKEDRQFVHELYGSKGDIMQPPEEFAAGKTTLEGIKNEFPADEYLFSGTMVSDDYFSMSRRAGRNGTLYATPFIDYAKKYDGIYDLGADKRGGYSVTGDAYKSSAIGIIQEDSVHIGFINIYKQSEDDKFFKNFGLDDARRSASVHLSREDALNGYLSYSIDGNGDPIPVHDAETYVDKEKNPLVAKIMHIKCGKDEYYMRIPENPDELTQYLLNARQADKKDTFKGDKSFVLERLSKQKEEFDKGILYGNKLISQQMSDVEKIKTLRMGQPIEQSPVSFDSVEKEISQEMPKDEKTQQAAENQTAHKPTVNQFKKLRGLITPTKSTKITNVDTKTFGYAINLQTERQ